MELLKLQEAAAYVRLQPRTLRKLAAEKKIPHIKPTKILLFDKVDLDNWLLSRRIEIKDVGADENRD